jgi:hypothetical protein
MPVRVEEIADGKGLIYRCEGVVTGNDQIDANEMMLAHPDRLRGRLFGIVDHTHATATEYTPLELANIAAQDFRIAKFVVPGFMVAIVAPEAPTQGFSQMWETLASATGWEIMTVRTYSEAEAWIKNRSTAKFGVELTF